MAFALEVIGRPNHVVRNQVPAILELVGLSKKMNNFPHELSGGEQQRVSIARAFVNRPLILLADEPTGNLDPATSVGIMRLLDRINRTGTTVVMATPRPGHRRHHAAPRRRARSRHHRARPGPWGVRVTMAMKANYLVRETGSNLRRNITLTLASIVTVAVSLALFGIALLLRQGVDNATQRWEGGIEFVVFMNADASAAQLQAVADALDASPEVAKITFFDQDKAFEEFKDLFEGTPELIETVQPSDLPTSFRVVPSDTDPDAVEQLANRFETSPGVREVVSAQETIRNIESLTNIASFIVLSGSVFLLAAAAALIFNTIRMAMFARRREIEVMKLVGATNWFIRLPFMVEGMIQGLLGAAVAVGAVFGANWALDRYLSDRNSLQLLESFVVATSDVWRTSFLLVVIGVIVGTVGSAIAVSRFLDV